MKMSQWEMSEVIRIIRGVSPRSSYLEIGSYYGGSLLGFGMEMDRGAKVVSVDKKRDPESLKLLTRVESDLSRGGFFPVLINGNSHSQETLDRVKQEVDSVDVLYIDGDHSYAGVWLDASMYAGMVRKGGIVMFHDCGFANTVYREQTGDGMRELDDCRRMFHEFVAGYSRIQLIQEHHGVGVVWV